MRAYDDPGVGEAGWRPSPQAGRDVGVPPRGLVAGRLAEPAGVLELQRLAGNAAVAQLVADGEPESDRSPVLNVVGRGGGQPLDLDTRRAMEAGLGADFGEVRVHTDGAAAASARSVQAHAYTVGNEVVFQSGLYQPETAAGQRMLAHELTHVVQQRSGPVDGTPAGGGVSVSDPSDRFERAAEASAERFVSSGQGSADGAVMSGPAGVQRTAEDDVPVQGAFVQRQAMAGQEQEEEETAQGSFVQRQGDEEEEKKEEEPVTG